MSAKDRAIVEQLIGSDERFDAKIGAFIDQQLEAMEAAIYRTEYTDLKAREHLPLKTDVPMGATTFAYFIWDAFARADFVANYSDELPNTAIRGEKKVGKIESIANEYSYSSADLRAAQMTGLPLDSELAIAAARAHEERVDQTALLGHSGLGFVGFFKDPSIAIINAAGVWASATGVAMLNDMLALLDKVVTQSNGKHAANRMVLDLVSYRLANRTLVNSAGSTSDTVLAAFNKIAPQVTVAWDVNLATASGAAGKRAVAYLRDPKVVSLVLPMEVQVGEPEKRGLSYVRTLESRFGGSALRQPLACAYMEGM